MGKYFALKTFSRIITSEYLRIVNLKVCGEASVGVFDAFKERGTLESSVLFL